MRWLPLLPLLALAPASLAAGNVGPPEIIELRLNGQATSTTLVVRRDSEGALLVRAADLHALRLRPTAARQVIVDGEAYLRLGPGGGAQVAFDEAAQSAEVLLPPDAFLPTAGSVDAREPPPVTRAAPGGFANYELVSERTDDQRTHGATLELGAFGSRGVATSTFVARADAAGREALRLESTWTLDLPSRLATLRVGDAVSASGAWGRAVRFAGLQFGTNFATQPTLVTVPLLEARGEAVVPSTVDVFLNGQRVASQEVPPGPFSLDRLPPITGAGEMQVVVTDMLGRQQVLAMPYYTGPALLRAGLEQYSFELGAIREDYGFRSAAYGDLVLSGTYRRGLGDRLTAELHAEGQAGGARAMGADVAWQPGRLGVLTLTSAFGGDGATGWLGGLGFERDGPRFSVFARSQWSSARFAQLGDGGTAERLRHRAFGGVGLNLGPYGSVRASAGVQKPWAGRRTETYALSHAVTLGPWGHLALVASHVAGTASATDLFLYWTLAFGERRTASMSLRQPAGAPAGAAVEAEATLEQSLPKGPGTGYSVAASSADRLRGEYVLQGAAGTVGLQYARSAEGDGLRASARGALAVTAAGLMAARRLDASFAVVEVADYAGMTVYVENQPVGRTDGRGRILLDALRAYEGNRVSIDPRELPLDAVLAGAVTNVTPAWRSGPVVTFPVARASAATLRLALPGGQPVPAGARVTTPQEEAPVAVDGLLYLTMAGGRQAGRARWPGGSCRFEFERPAGDEPLPDLGTQTCLPDPEPAEDAT